MITGREFSMSLGREAPQEDMLTGLRSGDVEALAALYDLHAASVYVHAYHLLGSEDDAQDVRQETFLRAWRSVRSFRGDCSLKTWLLKICTNLCRTHSRKAHVRRESIPIELAELHVLGLPHSPDPYDALSKQQMAATIRSVLDDLPPSAREIVVMRDVEALEMDEIAQVLGCSRGSLRVMLCRARSLLRQRVRALLDEER